MNVGVLALQGGFAEHLHALSRLGVHATELRKKEDLQQDLDALILPGGESTVMGRLLGQTGMFEGLCTRISNGIPVWGTCAGMILLAKQIEQQEQTYFGMMPITVRRNAFGRQLGSFQTEGTFAGVGTIPMTFIRAPYILEAQKNVQILSTVQDHMVAARYENLLVTAFHPELTEDLTVLQYFLGRCS